MADAEVGSMVTNEIAEAAAVAEWLAAAVRGEPVSEFGESFAAVREAQDLRAERDDMARRGEARDTELREVNAELDKHGAPAAQKAQDRIRMWAVGKAIDAENAANAAYAKIAKAKADSRRRMPAERDSKTHKFSVAGHDGYLTVGMYEDGTPGELFIRMAKEGSTVSGLMDCFATAVSLALQHGVPLGIFCEKFTHTRFDPAGFTGNPDIPRASSVMDYLFHWLQKKFLPDTEIADPAQTEMKP